MSESVRIEGLSELAAALRELPKRIARNTLRGAVRAAAVVIRDEAKSRAPVSTGPAAEGHPPPGTLRKSIFLKQIAERSSLLQQVFFVTVRRGTIRKYGKTKLNVRKRRVGQTYKVDGAAFYARFVEFGTSKMAARPFLRPAFEARKEDAVEALRAYLAERIPREAAALPGRR